MHSVLYKKQNLTDYIQYYKKNGGTDTKAMGQTEPQFLSDPMSDRKKKFSPTLVSTDQHVYVCRSLQINIATYPLNPNNISRYFPLIGAEMKS